MIVDVEVPQQGLTITEATLIRWVKQPGDTVKAGELLFEIETDKAVVEVESPDTGRLLTCLAAEGDVVPLGHVVAKIGTEAADILEATVPEVPAPHVFTEKAVETPKARPSSNGSLSNARVALTVPGETRPVASPRARRAADQLGIDLASVSGTGRRGRHIRERDVLLAAEHRDTQPQAEPMPRLKRITAQRTTASFRDVPHFYLTREISAERLLKFRSEVVDDIEKHFGIRVTVTDLLLRAVALALKTHPAINAQWRDESVALLSTVDVGVAVDTPDGLIVAVIRQADTLSLVETTKRRTEIVERARSGRSRPEDLSGGSFTISNLGAGGVDQFDAIINTPQSGILSVGAIKLRPYVVDGVLAAVNTLILTASMDHRVVDGAEAARFLSRIADLLENPALLCSL